MSDVFPIAANIETIANFCFGRIADTRKNLGYCLDMAHCSSSRPSALWMDILHPTGNISRFANVGSLLSNPALHRTGHFFSREPNLVLHKTAQFKEVVTAKFPTLECT